MHPVIAVFQLPILGWVVQLDWYPLMHFLGFVVLVGLTLRLYRRDVGPSLPALDPLLVGVAAGIVGARLVGAWTAGKPLPNFLDAPLYWWIGNKSAYGGILFGVAGGAIAARLGGLPLGRYLDAATPGVALATVCARLGCFLGGCCFGVPTHSFLGVHFPEGHTGMASLALAGDARGLHPTQLYLAGSALVIAGIAGVMRHRRVGRPGDRFLVAAALYAASIFGIEFLRGDTQRFFAAGLSHSQWISLAVLVLVAGRMLQRLVRVPLRPAVAAATLALVLAAGVPPARAQDAGAGDGMLETAEVMVQALASGHPGAADTFAWLLELGDGRLATWSRLGLGAEAAMRGDLDRAVEQWRTAAEIDPGTAWGAQGDLALGLGHLMRGQREQATAAFRRAAAHGEGDTTAVAEVSLGRLLMAQGDRAGAERSFRRVFDDYPTAPVADDAALGLARSLRLQGRIAEAREVSAVAAQRYERRGRYMNGSRGGPLRWDRVGRLRPERLGELLREQAAEAIATGRPPLDVLLTALTDQYVGRELRRERTRLARAGEGADPAVQHAVARTVTARDQPARPPASGSPETPAAPARRTGHPMLLAVLAAVTLVGLGAALRRRGARFGS